MSGKKQSADQSPRLKLMLPIGEESVLFGFVGDVSMGNQSLAGANIVVVPLCCAVLTRFAVCCLHLHEFQKKLMVRSLLLPLD